MTQREPPGSGQRPSTDIGADGGAATDGGGLPYPANAEEAARMERVARAAERHIGDLHEDGDPDDRPIYEE